MQRFAASLYLLMFSRLHARLERLWHIPFFYALALALIAAATPLAFAPYYHFWLMPLLFGALIRLAELKPKHMVLSAYLFWLVAYSSQFWWIHTAMHDVSGLDNVFAVPLTFLMPAVLALYPALAFALWRRFGGSRTLRVGVVLPMLWTLAEFAREQLVPGFGFGWGALGYSQIAEHSPLAGFAPLAGIHAVTWATAALAAWLVLLVDTEGWKERAKAACIVALIVGAGCFLRTQEFTQNTGRPVSVAAVQGNIEQQLKFDESRYLPTYQLYYDLVKQTHAQIVVLPETAFPQFLQNIEPEILTQFAQAAERNGSELAVGVPAFTEDGRNYLNAIVTLPNTQKQPAQQMYAKNHLVPFGEYKPLPIITNPLYQFMNMPLADFQRGGANQAPLNMAGEKVAFNICYEDGFGDDLIAPAKQSTLLANSSNMAWFAGSNAMWQQLQQSQARALEMGRYMIRATNRGATAIVSPQGNIVSIAPSDVAGVLEGTVQGRTGETPYMRLGGSYPLAGLLVILLALIGWKTRRKPPAAQA